MRRLLTTLAIIACLLHPLPIGSTTIGQAMQQAAQYNHQCIFIEPDNCDDI